MHQQQQKLELDRSILISLASMASSPRSTPAVLEGSSDLEEARVRLLERRRRGAACWWRGARRDGAWVDDAPAGQQSSGKSCLSSSSFLCPFPASSASRGRGWPALVMAAEPGGVE